MGEFRRFSVLGILKIGTTSLFLTEREENWGREVTTLSAGARVLVQPPSC